MQLQKLKSSKVLVLSGLLGFDMIWGFRPLILFIYFVGCEFLDPMVKFLREHLEKAGCSVGDKFIKAVECDKQIGGGYVPGEGVYAYIFCFC